MSNNVVAGDFAANLTAQNLAASDFVFFSKMAESGSKLAASPLHNAELQSEEEPSGGAAGTSESALVETEKSAPVETGESAPVETGESAPVETGESVPVETGASASVEKAKPVEESPQEENDEAEAKRKAWKLRQEELKNEIISNIEKRRQQIEQGNMSQEVQPPVAPPEELDPAAAAKAGLPHAAPEAPEAAAPEAVGAVKVKEEQLEDSDHGETESSLVVQDLRWCTACQSKSYIRQGLCINIYCRLYYMGRSDSGTRLCARGKLSEGRKWSPKEWVESGQFAKTEEQLLTDNWKEAIEAVEGLPPPEMRTPMPAKLVSSEPITIEDMGRCGIQNLLPQNLMLLLMLQQVLLQRMMRPLWIRQSSLPAEGCGTRGGRECGH